MKTHSTLGKVSFGISIAILVILLSGFLMIQYKFFKYGSAAYLTLVAVLLFMPLIALSNLIVSTVCLFDSTKRRLLPMISFFINLVIFASFAYVGVSFFMFFYSFDSYNLD